MEAVSEKHAERGAPSYVWRDGQERRLAMIRQWSKTEDSFILVDGCGLGAYAAQLLDDSPNVYAFDIEHARVTIARENVSNTHVSAAEHVPYPDNTFDVILSHEVLEHVQDDATALSEIARILQEGGRAIIFVPNRWYPFETHGHYWRGKYYFGNTPLINYLPDRWRNKLAPHVKAYRKRELQEMIKDLPVRIVYHTRIYGGYDNIIARLPRIGRLMRGVLYFFEKTPLKLFGLSHLLVIEKTK